MVLKKAVERERRLLIDSGSSVLAEKLRYLLFVKLQFCCQLTLKILIWDILMNELFCIVL